MRDIQYWWQRATEVAAVVYVHLVGLSLQQAATIAAGLVVGYMLLRRGLRWLRRSARRARRRAVRRFTAWLCRGLRTAVTFRSNRRPTRYAPMPVEPGGPTVLYRHFDAAGRLLYVGITDASRGGQRWHEHADDKPWFRFVARSEVSHPYPTRADALYAEALAIRDENPVHNICRPDPDRIGLPLR